MKLPFSKQMTHSDNCCCGSCWMERSMPESGDCSRLDFTESWVLVPLLLLLLLLATSGKDAEVDPSSAIFEVWPNKSQKA